MSLNANSGLPGPVGAGLSETVPCAFVHLSEIVGLIEPELLFEIEIEVLFEIEIEFLIDFVR